MALQRTDWLDLNQLALGGRQATTSNFRPDNLEFQAYVPMSDSRRNPAGSMLEIVYRDAACAGSLMAHGSLPVDVATGHWTLVQL